MDKNLNGMALHNLNILNNVIRQTGNMEIVYPKSVWLLKHTSGMTLQIESDDELESTLEEMAGTVAIQEAARRIGLTGENWTAQYNNLIDSVYAERDRILAIAEETS